MKKTLLAISMSCFLTPSIMVATASEWDDRAPNVTNFHAITSALNEIKAGGYKFGENTLSLTLSKNTSIVDMVALGHLKYRNVPNRLVYNGALEVKKMKAFFELAKALNISEIIFEVEADKLGNLKGCFKDLSLENVSIVIRKNESFTLNPKEDSTTGLDVSIFPEIFMKTKRVIINIQPLGSAEDFKSNLITQRLAQEIMNQVSEQSIISALTFIDSRPPEDLDDLKSLQLNEDTWKNLTLTLLKTNNVHGEYYSIKRSFGYSNNPSTTPQYIKFLERNNLYQDRVKSSREKKSQAAATTIQRQYRNIKNRKNPDGSVDLRAQTFGTENTKMHEHIRNGRSVEPYLNNFSDKYKVDLGTLTQAFNAIFLSEKIPTQTHLTNLRLLLLQRYKATHLSESLRLGFIGSKLPAWEDIFENDFFVLLAMIKSHLAELGVKVKENNATPKEKKEYDIKLCLWKTAEGFLNDIPCAKEIQTDITHPAPIRAGSTILEVFKEKFSDFAADLELSDQQLESIPLMDQDMEKVSADCTSKLPLKGVELKENEPQTSLSDELEQDALIADQERGRQEILHNRALEMKQMYSDFNNRGKSISQQQADDEEEARLLAQLEALKQRKKSTIQ